MAGDSPLSMMRPAPRRSPRATAPRRPLRRCLIIAAIIIVVAIGWCGSWYFAAGIADRAERGWIEREAELGRVYACGSQSIGGFPFSIVSRCVGAAATFSGNKPPFDVRAAGVTFSAQVFRPTLLNGEIQGPVTLANPGESPIFTANWTNARLTLLGLPSEPERVAVSLDKPRLDRLTPPGAGMIFQADTVSFDGSIVQGSAHSNPVIEAVGHFTGATAPTTHPLLAQPLQGDIDAVMRGFKDFAPKPWPVLFREMQAAGGGIDIRSVRIERPDAIIVGNGTLTVNEQGKLDGQIDVAVAGIDNIVPLLDLDQVIGQSIDRFTGGSGSAAAGLGALDQLVPGLSGVVRQGASAGLISNIKKMGKPTEIDKKPAITLPLRVGDGVIYLGVIPIGALPALF
ncbi:MAG TPA: DUF2125 domain-containing protein [Xanthobacteraceae bacterium]|jgi:hypothetical protein|nr:DUF2125 domain-containing protein [Xanthobacteraceae bacterium]